MRYAYPVVAIAVMIAVVFYHFPVMGHDFLMFLSWANDYRIAWQNHGVFNIQFSPQRCLGIPVWANPVGANFTLFHLLSLYLKDIYVAVAMIIIYGAGGFWGSRKFVSLFQLDEDWKNYFSIGWILQGYIISHIVVGHVGFITATLWPLYAYLLLKPEADKKRKVLWTVLFSLLISHEFYLALVYLYVIFPMSFLLLLVVLHYLKSDLDLRESLIRFLAGMGLSFFIILPKVMAMMSFSRNFHRESAFVMIHPVAAIEYTFMSKIFPLPLNYQKMTGWWYGHWESTNYLFPILTLICFVYLTVRFRQHTRLAITMFGLLGIGAFISSGIYRDLVAALPIVKSFHVNPRWMLTIHLAFFFFVVKFVQEINLTKKIVPILVVLNVAMSFLLVDREEMNLSYDYGSNYNPTTNRLSVCYEPIFGHRLELFPMEEAAKGNWLDPRCYVSKNPCSSLQLPEDKVKELLDYKLRPLPE
jgi:hypothetical protein